jgi:hypothetical protein
MVYENLQEKVNALLATNVNNHTEKKNSLTYLSWAWAWAEALKADANATYKIEMFEGKPFVEINGTAMVMVTATLFGKPLTCQLPVMDYRNKAIPSPDAFAVNTAIMRCMTKALSLHGLGLYIYAGEDLPENWSDEGSPDEGKMIDYISAIEAATTLDELKNIYIEAFASTDGNKAWQTKMIAAKDAKKASLK